MTTQKVRRGMHVRLNWPILRAGVNEDFSNAESLSLHISRVNNNVKTFIPDTHIGISGNVVSFIVTSDMLKSLTSGEYKATIAYRKVSATSPTFWEPYIKDEPCFALVDSSAEIGGSTTGMEVVTIELDGEIGLPKEGLPGASAYRIALAHGFEGDESEWLYSLKKPALDAATAADTAAGAANAATSELDAIKLDLSQAETGRNTAEGNRETKEGERQEAEQNRGTAEEGRKTAERNRETKEGERQEAEQNRGTAEEGRKTAEGNRETKEGERQEAEQNRGTAEEGRKTAEGNRETKEGERQEAEQNRGTAEEGRKTAEENRETKEGDRENAEQRREESEAARGTTFDQKMQSAEAATTAANASAVAQNTFNITTSVPLAAGVYYNSSSARLAVPVVSRKRGLVLTYETAAGIWYAERFKGTDLATWTTAANWEQVPDSAQVSQLYSDMNYMYPSIGTSKRILADAGTIKSRSTLNDLTNKFLDLLPNTKLLFCPHLAVKLRESGNYKYVTKLYDIGPGMLDGAQTTALNQPFLCGNIAPAEKYALKNPNGGNSYIAHAPISFTATDKWSVSTVVKPYGFTYGAYIYGNRTLAHGLVVGNTDNAGTNYGRFLFSNAVGTYPIGSIGNNLKNTGKTHVLTLVCDGSSIKLYVNSTVVGSSSNVGTIEFNSIISSVLSGNHYNGSINYHAIRNIALTQQQVAEEHSYLRTLFPEIESVQIGAQNWATSNCEMTCTPKGNVIPEMQNSTNVEKIVNGGFDTTDNWLIVGQSTISGGVARVYSPDAALSYLSQSGVIVVGKWYKVTYSVIQNNGGNVSYTNNSTSLYPDLSVGNNKTFYFKATESNFFLKRIGTTNIIFDNISVQEVGWADSTNLYNDIYAQTTGTAEQKEYAAVKAAAMWCHYNNDPALGAIYGKLYNWYAVRLLQMDIDYYNAANPTTPWGWRIPTSSDFITLSTYLGGSSVAGGKMKKEGIDYWLSPNLGEDNSNGLSLIGSGFRQIQTGDFIQIKSRVYLYTLNNSYQTTYGYTIVNFSNSLDIAASSQISTESCGMALRLIKA